MLTSRGLRALLLGLSATASVLNRHVLPVGTGGQVQISGGEASEAHHSLAEGTQQGLEVTRGVKRRQTGSRTDRSQSQDSSSQTSNRSKWSLQPREVLCSQANGTDYTCPNGLTCCLSTAGQPDCCPIGNIECVGGSCVPPPPQEPSAAGPPIVVVTQTLTSTVTVFTGSPVTSLVRATKTVTITLLDPTEATQTATVTATAFLRKAKRDIDDFPTKRGSEGDHETQLERAPEREVGKRQEQTVTSTRTAQAVVTVFRQSVVLGTLTDTVFSTKYAAPNAVTTVFVTTTVFVPAGQIPSTEAPTAIPTVPGGSPAPVPTTTLNPPPSSAPTNLPSSASRTSSSSVPLPTSIQPTPTQPTMTTMTTMTMMTMANPSTTISPTPSPTVLPEAAAAPRYTTTQIIGIAVGALLGLILLVLLAFGLRRVVRNRRSAQAQMRQQLSPPLDGGGRTTFAAAAAPRLGGPRGGGGRGGTGGLATNGSASSGGSGASGPSNHSALTGEGEVRIVIRPAPKRRTQSSQLWPMPPGHRGRTYSLFVEETTTGETTPQDPGEWSIASERGSVRDGTPGRSNNSNTGNTTIYSTNDPGYTGVERASGSGGRPSTSIFSAGWDRETSFGARSDASYPGLGTLLTPPPAWHGHAAERGWPRPLDPADVRDDDESDRGRGSPRRYGERSSTGTWYPSESLGIGKAV